MKSKDIKVGLIGFGSVGKQLYNTLLENDYNIEQIYVFADDVQIDDEKRLYIFNDFKLEKFSQSS